jgi:hypothetical protein
MPHVTLTQPSYSDAKIVSLFLSSRVTSKKLYSKGEKKTGKASTGAKKNIQQTLCLISFTMAQNVYDRKKVKRSKD